MDEDEDTQIGPAVGLVDEVSGTRSGQQARQSRKRTKTGCLTCRRRRIKCGEERPTCGNCIKSKRQCEGYNQRVIFKEPLITYRGPASATQVNPPFNARQILGTRPTPQDSQFHYVQPESQTLPPNIIRNPDSSPSHGKASSDSVPVLGFPAQSGEASNRRVYEFFPPSESGYGRKTSIVPGSGLSVDSHFDTIELSYLPEGPGISKEQTPSKQGAHYDFNSLLTYETKQAETHRDSNLHPDWSNGLSCAPESPFQEQVFHSDVREAASTLLTKSYQGNENWPLYLAQHNPVHRDINPHLQSRIAPREPEDQFREEVHQGMEASHEDVLYREEQKPELQDWVVPEELPPVEGGHRNQRLSHVESESPTFQLALDDQDCVEPYLFEEDIFDKSDEEMGLEDHENDALADSGKSQYDHLKDNDLGIFVALQASQDMQDQRLRTYRSYLDSPNVLTTYQPSARTSPLNDSTAARIFYHFVHVTGPSISLYERHPANPSLMFQGRPVPRSQQHIWAYTLPTLALSNQALLHAMLAIGSLHIAFLQDDPVTPALKHYHLAIRRVAKGVRLPTRRGQLGILAATVLLGWYELMSGDHQKWSSHLLGATQLLKEVDFAGITKFLKKRKLQQRQARHGNLYHHDMALGIAENHFGNRNGFEDTPKYDDVNEGLVSMILGKKLRYDEYGQVLEDLQSSGNQQRVYTQRELETYDTQRDLFWWYCKQDAFQSVLSGNRLFLPYDWWSHCPPRAAIGKRDATYGTFDHLILLLGRLAEFAAKDLKRKRKAMQANGGYWRPPPGAAIPPAPAGQNPPAQSAPPQMPSFAGMMPGTEGKTKLPRGFSPTREDSPVSEDDSRSLNDWSVEADEEWHEIHSAFAVLEENFGPDFQPLGPEHCQSIESPFGPALQYRTYSIAGIWIIYYMSLILCHRYHPSMPPAATIAAGIAASKTGFYANEIGRISAAMAPSASRMAQVSTLEGASLIECSFGLFIAGIQFQNPAQRSWLIYRCLDIKRLTGWQTVEAVAHGCETAWVKTAQMGRGPPYIRVMEKKIDQEEWYNSRRTDPVSLQAQDRSKLLDARTGRVHYALGLIGVQQELENLDFESDERA